jgi:SAM-dependent methyltransferase
MFFNPFGKEYAWAPRWNRLERLYIRTFGVVDLPSRLRARLVVREMRKYVFDKLLDFGCGAGTYSFYFSRMPNRNVEAIDINELRIGDCEVIKARLGCNKVTFYVGNSHDGLQRFEKETFDAVLGIEVFQYIPDLRLVLRNIQSLLKPGGILIGHVPALGYLRKFENVLFNDNNVPYLLEEAGFEILLLTSTFGGMIRRLCGFYERIVNHKNVTALVYPFLLLLSSAFEIESTEGDYRFFIARKPLS